ncbi:MAG: 4-hydroxy-tetrahydrodipicolinate reductase [Deltaproteobacteria bacterium CG2_30_63_29]|nr:MAG: 4-hydroxy-tetrahydrodipicolinate reductase [Deltaproteobacteria bacterium CG2_30_63_29]PJB33969.1 MAG: 4-hydroxy-tetrahydrodipicolinate reductase [Deltaproteobacteria bacterium CG_4_9_14_3_um_filter_63_12]
MTLKVAIHGAAGRMGRGLLQVGLQYQNIKIVAAIEREDHPLLGHKLVEDDRCPLLIDDLDVIEFADVLIDFSHPEAILPAAEHAAKFRKPFVSGTTGFHEDVRNALYDLADQIPMLLAPNMSLGVNLMLSMLENAASKLPEDWEAEILELHHRFKKDSPSGTAMALAAALAKGRSAHLEDIIKTERPRVTERPRGREEIGVMALRGGDVVGEHCVYLFGTGERIELTHRATDRMIFVRGALHAARWIVGRAPGRYSMRDTLDL